MLPCRIRESLMRHPLIPPHLPPHHREPQEQEIVDVPLLSADLDADSSLPPVTSLSIVSTTSQSLSLYLALPTPSRGSSVIPCKVGSGCVGRAYLMVFPVLNRIHCGIGRFCFCARASFCFVRKDLWLYITFVSSARKGSVEK